MNLFLLYFEFFKTGLFAIGGGLATLPFLFQMADKYEWLDNETVGNFLAIAQSAPGPIGVNMAAQTGFLAGGIAGSCIASLGLISPAIVIVIFVAMIFKSIKENKIMISVFSALRPASAGLIAAAGFGALKLALYNQNAAFWYEILRIKEFVIFAIIFLAIIKLKLHPIIYIIAGAVVGIILKL